MINTGCRLKTTNIINIHEQTLYVHYRDTYEVKTTTPQPFYLATHSTLSYMLIHLSGISFITFHLTFKIMVHLYFILINAFIIIWYIPLFSVLISSSVHRTCLQTLTNMHHHIQVVPLESQHVNISRLV